MKKTNVIIGTITGLLIATIVGAAGFVSYANNKVDEISRNVINSTYALDMSDADTLAELPVLNDEVKSIYTTAKAKERMFEIDEQADELEYAITGYMNDLTGNMSGDYKYRDAYENINLILSKSNELNELIDEHNDILYNYPEFGEGLFEHGEWMVNSSDLFDLDCVFDAYSQILMDTWYHKNFQSAKNNMMNSMEPHAEGYNAGLIFVTKYQNVTEHMIIQEDMGDGHIDYVYDTYYNMNRTSEIIEDMNETGTFASIGKSITNTTLFDKMIDIYYLETSTNLANDVNDKYRNSIKLSGNPFYYEAHLWVTRDDDDNYVLDKETYRQAVTQDFEKEFGDLVIDADNEGIGVAFGYVKYCHNGYELTRSNPMAITEDDISNSDITSKDMSITNFFKNDL